MSPEGFIWMIVPFLKYIRLKFWFSHNSQQRIPVALSSSVSSYLKAGYVRFVLFQHLTSVSPYLLRFLMHPLYNDLGGTMYLLKVPFFVAAIVPLWQNLFPLPSEFHSSLVMQQARTSSSALSSIIAECKMDVPFENSSKKLPSSKMLTLRVTKYEVGFTMYLTNSVPLKTATVPLAQKKVQIPLGS